MMQLEDFLARLQSDFSQLKFRLGKKFKYRPPHIIYYETPPADTQMPSFPPEQNLQQASFPLTDEQKCLNTNKNHPSRPDLAPITLEQNYYLLQLLHEVGHALLGHRSFQTDLERVRMERAAWDQAKTLCVRYQIPYDEEFVEAELDTYRDWLHQRSVCRACNQVRYQTLDGAYHCPFCEAFQPQMAKSQIGASHD